MVGEALTDEGRLNDPKALSLTDITEACERRGRLVVQFSHPTASSAALLETLNEACRQVGDRLEIRFYAHYGGTFDATVLRHLPEVQSLSVDCLAKIAHEDEIGKLSKLKRLSFSVFQLDRPDFLETIDFSGLQRLSIGENRKRNIDLSPLSHCQTLDNLFIHGHAKGVEAIAGLPRLRRLALSGYAKAHGLDFVSAVPCLKELELILGGRPDVEDLSSRTLETLQIIRVRGLAGLGDLSRFPKLSALRIEDQVQISELDLSGARLERLWLFNCKSLARLSGLDDQDRLAEFFASGVALDLDALRDRAWPAPARSIKLFSGSRKWNDEAGARLAARGLGERASYWL